MNLKHKTAKPKTKQNVEPFDTLWWSWRCIRTDFKTSIKVRILDVKDREFKGAQKEKELEMLESKARQRKKKKSET